MELYENNMTTAKREGEQEDVEVAEGHELNVLPENEYDKKKEEIITSVASRRLSKSKKDYRTLKKQKQQEEITLKDVFKQIQKQSALIHKTTSILQHILKQVRTFEKQFELINQMQTDLKQLQKQTSEIQRIKVANKKK